MSEIDFCLSSSNIQFQRSNVTKSITVRTKWCINEKDFWSSFIIIIIPKRKGKGGDWVMCNRNIFSIYLFIYFSFQRSNVMVETEWYINEISILSLMCANLIIIYSWRLLNFLKESKSFCDVLCVFVLILLIYIS